MRYIIFINLVFILSIEKGISQSRVDIINQEYSHFTSINKLYQLEDSLNLKINSLGKCLIFGDYWSGEILEAIKERTRQIAKKHYETNNGLVLTWGTNGNCGRQGESYDELTIKYGFRYISVNCSCLVGNIPKIVEAYNSYSYPILEEKNGKNWKKNLEKEILAKKRNIALDIENFEIDKLDEIYISNKELKKYPKEVEELLHLKKIYFNINQLSNIGSGICSLNKLEILSLHSNNFKKFPREILCLENLKKLYFDKNKLKRISSKIHKLHKLEEFNLGNNKLKKLPNDFSKLTELKWLDLRDNKLETLPDDFHQLKNLETLILWDNKFKNIPKTLYSMKHLKTLFIDSGNTISKSELEKLRRELPNTEIK